MKIIYIATQINNEGGIARVLQLKANYFVENFNYEVHIITQNNGHLNPFYTFHKNIVFHDLKIDNNKLLFLNSYKNQLNNCIKKINPKVIINTDNGYKGYLLPFLLKKLKLPIIFESHGSIIMQYQKKDNWFISKFNYNFRLFFGKFFNDFVVLSEFSKQEWNYSNCTIISNPILIIFDLKANLNSKKVIAVGRHTFEKGFDDLLHIWKQVLLQLPDYQLVVYGEIDANETYLKLAKKLKIDKNVTFYNPVKNIHEKYCEASLLLMTSKYEGFPMVLLEALSVGLPCIAFDCPVGPRALIQNSENGYLIPLKNQSEFVEKVVFLFKNDQIRAKMSKNASKSIEKYNIELIMQQWKKLLEKYN